MKSSFCLPTSNHEVETNGTVGGRIKKEGCVLKTQILLVACDL